MPAAKFYEFLPDGSSFRVPGAPSCFLYAPLCGVDGTTVKSSITPYLSGDIKTDKDHYLTKPVSREDLRGAARNFFARVEGRGVVSMADQDVPAPSVEVGQLWHKVTRRFSRIGLELSALSFIPVDNGTLELTRFSVRNISNEKVTVTPVAAIPIFGRALANKHDHEHVTALLNRVTQVPQGVLLEPTMRFNEEGHKVCADVYFVLGIDDGGKAPVGTFPTCEAFFGSHGGWLRPQAVVDGRAPRLLSEVERQGQEAVGALRFADTTLAPGAVKEFIVAIGMGAHAQGCAAAFGQFDTPEKFDAALKANSAFWAGKTSAITFHTADADFDAWMRWVTLQPVLRRIFGCSFLPDHDYGKGGKGWRDIWQDLLSLILIEPGRVRGDLLNNFAGVRVDGANATIIGQKPGEFIADRNAITRVWMDHGVWPFLTTMLYVDQTGDDAFLFEPVPYFSDPQMARGTARDTGWTPASGNQLKDKKGNIYRGSVLEHILIQHLVQFYNVGEHNITRLESADWNDGLDMAFKRGESVAFMSFYGGNMLAIAALLERLAAAKGLGTLTLARELGLLLDTLGKPVDYDDAGAKRRRLFDEYFKAVQPELSGEIVAFDVAAVIADLRKKGAWVLAHIRTREKVTVARDGESYTWFNGYYDNNGERFEGLKDGRIWMTLTGQVFPLMNRVASVDEARAVARAVGKFLKDEALGGYRLNTDLGLRHNLAMGRAFGFAFGTKENGAVFSHMCVMYAYALYVQGLAREGHEVLRSLYAMSVHPQRAEIYPGVPEYFDPAGRGMYHFLTGSASWYVLTLLTQAYGVRGQAGDLVLAPQLVREEFDAAGRAKVCLQFAGRGVDVVYANPDRLDAGAYRVMSVEAQGRNFISGPGKEARIPLSFFGDATSKVEFKVTLGA